MHKLKGELQRIKRFLKRPLAITLVVLALAALAGALFASRDQDPLSRYDIVPVARGAVLQEVSVTGRVEPAEELELALERGGRVVSAPVQVGARVRRGQLLVAVSSGTLGAQQAEARAALSREEVMLDQLRREWERSGLPEAALVNARLSMRHALQNGFVSADSTLAAYVDPFYSGARTSPDFEGRFETSTGRTLFIESVPFERLSLESLRREVSKDMDEWKDANGALNSDIELDRASREAYEALDVMDQLLTNLALLLSTKTGEDADARAVYDALRSDIAAARSSTVSVRSSISAAQGSLSTAEAEVGEESHTTEDQIRLQEIAVDAARARLSAVNAQLAQGSITAPISGTITVQDARVGEFVSAGSAVVTLASDADFEIEVFVPEADIAKVAVGDNAAVTLDAFGDGRAFGAVVVSVDPAETLVEGVATFRVVLQFERGEEGIKPGMTANADIITGRAENVLFIPVRALITRDGRTWVRRVAEGDVVREVPVETGLRGSEGTVEIRSGLSEGDRVVVAEREEESGGFGGH
jgi:RND family efflux transporter MFP subunit